MAFSAAAKSLSIMEEQPVLNGRTEQKTLLFNKGTIGKYCKGISRWVAKKGYHLFKPILKPIFFRLRLYFLSDFQQELRTSQERIEESLNTLEKRFEFMLLEIGSLQGAVHIELEHLRKMISERRKGE